LKTGLVFKWSNTQKLDIYVLFSNGKSGLENFMNKKNIISSSKPFENQTENMMLKDHSKTARKLCRENDHAKTGPSSF
jgi:hypothetical protein